MVHLHLDPRARCDRPPMVAAGGIEREAVGVYELRDQADAPAHAARDGHGDLVELDHQRVAAPAHRARADDEVIGAAIHGAAPALGHRPARAARAVERDVDRAVIEWIAPPARLIIGGKDAADETDDGQAEAAVVGDRVDIPPEVATRRDRAVEARSRITVEAARRPDKAAIGTPAPGWVLPPAQ